MKTKEIRILALVLAVCLVMHITTVKAQTTAPFIITHSNGGSFEFRADGKLVITGNHSYAQPSKFSWDPLLGSLTSGQFTSAGEFSTASGQGSSASGGSSTALGSYTQASGWGSTALGASARAYGVGSTASGYYATASGWGSTASGYWVTASGLFSTASGNETLASGYSSMASGLYTTASGHSSTASGARTEAASKHSHAVGVLNVGGGDPVNWVPTDPLFEVGNGGDGSVGDPALNERSNAVTVYKNGDMDVQGVITCAPGGDIPMFNPAP